MMFGQIVAIWLCSLIIVISAEAKELKRPKQWVNEKECGTTDNSVYQNSVHHGQWPFLASIYYIKNNRISFVCGGTIISKFAVITGERVKIHQDFKVN
jgi:hypothetical protein